jgi:hypothetical protein
MAGGNSSTRRPGVPGKRNVIILTSGITGSSVLAGFLSQSGYWAGDVTHKKEYDTYENEELVQLNLRIFQQAGYTGDYLTEFASDALVRIGSLSGAIDDTPYRQFLTKCDDHRPWIWKDPRLWMTIYFWKSLLNLDECRFILLTRDFVQAWLSGTLRRHIISYHAFKNYEESIKDSIVAFLKSNGLPYLHVTYEKLIAQPDETIRELSNYLEADLTVNDLKAVYHKPLYRIPRTSTANSVKAVLIYIKNYSDRVDATRSR